MKSYTTAVDPRIDETPEQSQSLHPGGEAPQDVMTRDAGRGRGCTQALVIQQASMPSAQSLAPAIALDLSGYLIRTLEHARLIHGLRHVSRQRMKRKRAT
jgi:hypothetical protein